VLDGMGSTDDVAFASALIEHLTQTRTVEPRRIYAAGVSNGGFLVQRLACGSSQRIAAFASVAATLPQSLQPECHPSAPVSLLMINGTADQKVPWEGGQRPYGAIMSVPSSIQFWQQHNLCKTAKPTEQHPSSRVDITRYPSCQAGSEVELVTLKGAGHVWPRGGGGANQLLNGSQEIWNFFQRHPHR
jgi:polyhydroxybutyrate depolymerase